MNFETLHLCNIEYQKDIDEYIQLISKNDAIVFYAENLNEAQYNNLYDRVASQKCYFIIDNNINNLNTINYDKWLDLVNQYKKSFTWK